MAVGHPDYWRRMVSRVTLEGYAPEYLYHHMGGQVDAGEQTIYLQYSIPENYLYNVVGIFVSCSKPGINLLAITKEGAEGIPVYFDTTFSHNMTTGLMATMQYGDVMRVTIVNMITENAVFRVLLQALVENIA